MNAAATEVALELEGVSVGYGGAPAVRGVSLSVRAGEVVALLGSNGAGKTTTLRAAVGILPLVEGQVRYAGAATTAPLHLRARKGLSYVPEERGIIRALTVRENLRCSDVSIDEAHRQFPELQARLAIRAGLLSGGEQQMLALAIALGRSPRLLVADELSLGLAPLIVNRLLAAVRTFSDERGTGVLLVEQNARRAIRYADRVYVMRRGGVELTMDAAEAAANVADIEHAYL